jgi:signal transduction histidine kinase/DNA-binding response OmpR family regulator/predicted RNA-binding protein with RPS1 domain
MTSKPKISLVHVRVIKHLPQGLFVELDNGRQGIIRVREISWKEENAAGWKTSHPVGWSGFAVHIPKQEGEARELSLRLAENDPWDALPESIEKDRVFEGVVTNVVNYGAFIEISAGLTGLLHQSQLPAWCKKLPLDLFWPGDKVFVVIKEMDRDQRRISLGIPPIKYLVDGENSPITSMPKNSRDVTSGMEKLLEVGAPRKHVLVVEDEEAQAASVAGWLRKLGQRVDVVGDAETAINFLEKTQPDIALVDVGLPGLSGTDLALHILEQWRDVKVVITTDWARADDIMNNLEDLQTRGAQLLLKPLLPEDLVSHLLQEQKQERAHAQTKESAGGKLTLSDIPKLDAKKSIQALLHKCRKHLNCEQVLLFSLDPIHRKATIVERSGESVINKNALPYLIYSPVRDVAEDRDAILVNEINEQELNRFRYLLELCPSTVSCIGVPVPAQMPFEYALFALDKHARQITDEQQIFAEGMALAIGASLEHNNLMEKSILMQRTALIGHLTRAMMHEINNLVGPLLYEAGNLKESLSQSANSPDRQNYESLNDSIEKIQRDIRKIVGTTKIFGRIVAKGKDEVLRVDEIVYETLGLLHDISDRAHVVIKFTPPEKLMIVRSQAVVLEQIFLNVALNAVQQIAELRPEIGGWVQINMELNHTPAGDSICRILIEDNGPGIHASHWEKIFDAGFTTRPDGSGIGLYISRNLMEDIGGRIYVSKSHILSGALFMLEFPIHL